MKMHIKHADKVVGLFIILSLIGLSTVLILLGFNQRWFKRDFRFYSIVRQIRDLKRGKPITYKGFEIGRVDNIQLNSTSRMVAIDFHIYEEYYMSLVTENSIIELATNPLGLGSNLLFHPGKAQIPAKLPLLEGALINSYDQKAGIDLVRKGLVDREGGDDFIGSLIADLGPVIEKLDTTIYTVEQIALLVEEGLKGETTKNELGGILYHANRILASVDSTLKGSGSGPAYEIIENIRLVTQNLQTTLEDIMNRVSTAVAAIEQFAKLLEDPTGLLTRMIDPQGSIQTFLDDDNQLFDKVENILANIELIVSDIQKVTDFLSKSTPQITALIEEGNKTLTEVQDVLEALKNNPLLKGGITETKTQPDTTKSLRDSNF